VRNLDVAVCATIQNDGGREYLDVRQEMFTAQCQLHTEQPVFWTEKHSSMRGEETNKHYISRCMYRALCAIYYLDQQMHNLLTIMHSSYSIPTGFDVFTSSSGSLFSYADVTKSLKLTKCRCLHR
jgi:hypothetical protein